METAVDVEDTLDRRDWDWDWELERACDFWMGEESASWERDEADGGERGPADGRSPGKAGEAIRRAPDLSRI